MCERTARYQAAYESAEGGFGHTLSLRGFRSDRKSTTLDSSDTGSEGQGYQTRSLAPGAPQLAGGASLSADSCLLRTARAEFICSCRQPWGRTTSGPTGCRSFSVRGCGLHFAQLSQVVTWPFTMTQSVPRPGSPPDRHSTWPNSPVRIWRSIQTHLAVDLGAYTEECDVRIHFAPPCCRHRLDRQAFGPSAGSYRSKRCARAGMCPPVGASITSMITQGLEVSVGVQYSGSTAGE